MRILVKDIPKEGKEINFNSRGDRWFAEVLAGALADLYRREDHADGHVRLLKTGENIDCAGSVQCDCHPVCSRCLKVFCQHLDIPLHCTLAPFYESDRGHSLIDKKEVELVKEDIEFSYYEGDSFDLGDMVREQIVLNLPMQPVCRENCEGLCPQCGKNLNEGACTCKTKVVEKRWTPLRSL